jgi:hypothetical protein
MSAVNPLQSRQEVFFRALGEDGAPAGLRGKFDVYRHAYFERIRASIEEDYPRLFTWLAPIDAEAVTRDLLARNHPHSWTLAEASLPVRESAEVLLRQAGRDGDWTEARLRADLDEAEGLASWLKEYPEPRGDRAHWVSDFAEEKLRLALTKTWCVAGDRVFWRGENGVEETAQEEFAEFSAFFPLVADPIGFSRFSEAATAVADDSARIRRFLERGIAAGWLRLVPNES